MRASKIKKVKDALEKAFNQAIIDLEKEGLKVGTLGLDEKIQEIKIKILKDAGIKESEYEMAEQLFEVWADALKTKIRVGKIENKKYAWNDIEKKPDHVKNPPDMSEIKGVSQKQNEIEERIGYLSEQDVSLSKEIKNVEQRIRESIGLIKINHADLLGVGPDDHHADLHPLEYHKESDFMEKFKRLIGGGYVDDLHKHRFGENVPPYTNEPWGITKGDADSYYLKLNGTNSPSANINWGGFQINNVADPTLDQDVATKAYVDAQISGENWWDRIGTVLSPHHVGDTISVGGATLSGQLDFIGTTHAGVKLNSLTTTQMNALAPANGMIIYNTTDNKIEGYINGAWGNVGVTDHSQLSNLSYASAGHIGFEPTVAKGNLTTTTTGLAITGGIGSVIGSGATINADTGYGMPTTAKMSNWDTAYGWGNHASAGYLTAVTADSPLSGAGTSASHLTVDLSSKQNVSSILTALAGLTYVSGTPFVKMTGASSFSLDTSTYLTSVTAHNLLSTTHGDTVAGSAVLGDLIYVDATPNWTKLSGNTTTTKKFLRQIGTGAISAVPAWDTLVDGDIPSSLTGKTYNGLTLTSNADGFQISGGTISRTAVFTGANITFTGSGTNIYTFPGATCTLASLDQSETFTNKVSYNGLVITANTGVITTGTWNATVIIGQYGGTGVANTGKTITLGGNLTTSGAFALTLTLTNTTSITLPTAGTLATLLGSETFSNKVNYNGLVVTANTGVITTGTWNATIITGQYGGTGVANTGKTITLGGNFVTSGAYALTFTLSNTTSLTLPTTGTLSTLAGTETFTNKRITPRVESVASSSTPTPAGDSDDMYELTALAAAATFGAPTGTPVDGQKLIIRILDNGTARVLAWNAIYRAGTDIALPLITVLSKTLYCGFIYNSAATKWDLVAYVNNI